MVALGRLWWKDARQFWPIWAFLLLAALATQWALLYFVGRDVRTGGLVPAAIGWACLYAFAVAAAAFAGERETGTLGMLDAVPVPRSALWTAKASFALVSTAALAALLVAVAATGTDRWNEEALGPVVVVVGYCAVLVEALGWGLFWSSRLSNALTAAVTAIVCTGFVAAALARHEYFFALGIVASIPWRLGLAALTTLASAKTVIAPGVPRSQRWTGVKLRSPVVLAPTDRPRREFRGSGDASFWPLVWQTIREGRRAWLVLFLIGFVLSAVPFVLHGRGNGDPSAIMFCTVASLGAGVSAFNLENRGRTQKFLAHHGAWPGLVWFVKLAAWAFGLLAILVPLVVVVLGTEPLPARRGPEFEKAVIVVIAMVVQTFTIGAFCGMTIRRGITASVVASVAAMAVILPQIALMIGEMIHPFALLATPLALLVVTWAWSGEWMLDRAGLGRWVRLGALTSAAGVILFGGYVWGRAAVATAEPLAAPAAWESRAMSEPPANAAELYREADRKLAALPGTFPEVLRSVQDGIDPKDAEDVSAVLARDAEVIALVRQASARPSCRWTFAQTSLFGSDRLPNVQRLAYLVALEARDRQSRGDLAGAWDDLLVIFRMSRHVGSGAPLTQSYLAGAVEQVGFGTAFGWVSDPRQTPKLLRAAIASYKALPPAESPVEVVKVEAALFEKLLNLPAEELADDVLKVYAEPGRSAFSTTNHLWAQAMTLPWERYRARRVFRRYFERLARAVAVEPWQRTLEGRSDPNGVDQDVSSTPLVRLLAPSMNGAYGLGERTEVVRRALPVVFALRAWQLSHDGKYPEALTAVVPEYLDSLPSDPFANRTFGYHRSEGYGQNFPKLELVGFSPWDSRSESLRPANGRWLLWSAGPGKRIVEVPGRIAPGAPANQIVFMLPLAPGVSEPKPRPDAPPGAAGAGMFGIPNANLPPEPAKPPD